MKLLHKCITFLLLLILTQLVIFSVFLFSLDQSQQQLDEARRSVMISQRLTSLQRGLQEMISGFVLLIGSGQSPCGDVYQSRVKMLTTEYDNLERELKSDRIDYRDIQASRAGFNYICATVERMAKTFESGELDLPTLYRFKAEGQSGLRGHLNDTTNSILRIVARHSQKSDRLEELEGDRKSRFLLLVTVIFVGNIAVLSLVILWFSRGVSRRLGLLNDNFLRFGRGEQLNQRETGKDEIVSLDDAFRALTIDLEERAAKDRAVFTHMPSGLISCGEHGSIESINPTGLAMLGAKELSEISSSVAQLLAAGEGTGNGELAAVPENGTYQLRRVDGTLLPVDLTKSAFSLKGERKYLIALLDISAREEVQRMKQEFLSMVSHDLQAPLSSIGVCLEILKVKEIADSSQKYVDIAQGEAQRLIRLTRDILDLAKAETGKIVLHKTDISTVAIVEQAIGAIITLAERQQMEIVESVQPFKLYCDADKVIQILVNYLSNAIKYSSANSKIVVSVERTGQGARFSVTDHGRGIPVDSIDSVFDRFKQVYDKDSRIGTGLGLAICKILADAHGGTVGVKSELGRGSTFWLEVPIELTAG